MQPPESDLDAPPWREDPPTPHRRWPFVLVAVVLAAGAAGAGYAAWANYEAGADWRARALSQERRAEAAEERAAELADELARTESLLDRSEEDVALLESRLASLASEKAGAEDTAALAESVAENLTEVTVFAAEVGAALRDCIARNVALTNDIISSYNEGTFDPPAMNSRIESVNATCADAEGEYADLRRRLDALGG